MFLLDTNVISELRNRHRANENVRRWVERQQPSDLFISAVTYLEIEIGARRLIKRDPPAGTLLREWIDTKILPVFDTRILPVDRYIMNICAALQVERSRPVLDVMIAATAAAHGLVMVTRNVKDFADTGVKIVNPFDAL